MNNQKSNQNVPTSSEDAFEIRTRSSNAIHRRRRIVQNFSLIWLDVDIDQSREDCQNTLAQLQNVVNDVNIFTQQDKCIDFLTGVDDMKTFLILGDTLGSQIVPLIHNIPQLHSIYIFSGNKFHDEQWANEWIKIKVLHTDIKPICYALQLATKQFNQDSIAVSIVTASNVNLNQLEPCFMYTQTFKEIFFEMKHNEKSIKNCILFCGEYCTNNIVKQKIITEFERNYSPQSCVKWYNRELFIYEMLNY